MNDTITGRILGYSEDLETEGMNYPGKKGYVKCFFAGFIRGFVDGLVILGGFFWTMLVFFPKYIHFGKRDE